MLLKVGIILMLVNLIELWSFQWSQVKSLYRTPNSLENIQDLNYVPWNTFNTGHYRPNDGDLDDFVEKTDNNPQHDDYFMPHMKYAINRIFGGNEAQPNSFSYQVGILLQRPRGLYWCGGSLISAQFILTAAHCVDMYVLSTASLQLLEIFVTIENKIVHSCDIGRASRGLVFLGAHDIKNASEPGQLRIMVYPRNFILFPTWNSRKLKDDIALVRLPAAIEYNDKIRPIQLPDNDFEYKNFEGKLAIASGWGRYASGVHAISNVLRFVRLRITNGKVCRRTFPFSYRSTNICTSGANRKSTCNGDSGGPLVMQRKHTKIRVLVGITSFGSILGCDRGYPAAFTKVASYMDWISDETDIDSDDDVNLQNNFSFAEQFRQVAPSFALKSNQLSLYTSFPPPTTKYIEHQRFNSPLARDQLPNAICAQLLSTSATSKDDYKIIIFHS